MNDNVENPLRKADIRSRVRISSKTQEVPDKFSPECSFPFFNVKYISKPFYTLLFQGTLGVSYRFIREIFEIIIKLWIINFLPLLWHDYELKSILSYSLYKVTLSVCLLLFHTEPLHRFQTNLAWRFHKIALYLSINIYNKTV